MKPFAVPQLSNGSKLILKLLKLALGDHIR